MKFSNFVKEFSINKKILNLILISIICFVFLRIYPIILGNKTFFIDEIYHLISIIYKTNYDNLLQITPISYFVGSIVYKIFDHYFYILIANYFVIFISVILFLYTIEEKFKIPIFIVSIFSLYLIYFSNFIGHYSYFILFCSLSLFSISSYLKNFRFKFIFLFFFSTLLSMLSHNFSIFFLVLNIFFLLTILILNKKYSEFFFISFICLIIILSFLIFTSIYFKLGGGYSFNEDDEKTDTLRRN